MAERELRLLSVVAPMLNEEAIARRFYERVRDALEGLPWELVIVDDGSTDTTGDVLDEIAQHDPRLRVLHLSRAFGHQTALTAGLDHARGDAVVSIDGDLQDPPEVIPRLLDEWRRGVDVVVAKRRHRAGETRFKLATARWFYRIMGRLAQIDLEPDAGDFRLLDRGAVEALSSMRERSRFLRGMTSWIGFRQGVVEFDRDARSAGETKYPLRKMIRFAIDGISSFSHFPLQLATMLGFLTTLVAFLGLPLTVVARYSGVFERGVPTLLFVVLFLGGLQLMTLGLIGEYVGRIYDEVKRRPLYVVRDGRNLEPAVPPEGAVEPASVGTRS